MTVKLQLNITYLRKFCHSAPLSHPPSVVGGTSRYGEPTGSSGFFARSRLRNGADWPEVWTRTGTVPDVIPEAPPAPLFVSFPSAGIQIRPNDTITSGLMLQAPELSWEAPDPTVLHTLIMVDVDVPPAGGVPHYLHYLVVNIPGAWQMLQKQLEKLFYRTVCMVLYLSFRN